MRKRNCQVCDRICDFPVFNADGFVFCSTTCMYQHRSEQLPPPSVEGAMSEVPEAVPRSRARIEALLAAYRGLTNRAVEAPTALASQTLYPAAERVASELWSCLLETRNDLASQGQDTDAFDQTHEIVVESRIDGSLDEMRRVELADSASRELDRLSGDPAHARLLRRRRRSEHPE